MPITLESRLVQLRLERETADGDVLFTGLKPMLDLDVEPAGPTKMYHMRLKAVICPNEDDLFVVD